MSLCNYISEQFGVDLKSDELEEIFGYTLSYLTKGSSAFEYQEHIKRYVKACGTSFSAKTFRLRLHEHRYLLLTLKLFVLRLGLVKKDELDGTVVRRLAQEMEVPRDDYRRVLAVFREFPAFARRIRSEAKALKATGLLDADELDRRFNAVYIDVLKYIKVISYKKLRFICKSNNLDLPDMHSMLMTKALEAYYTLMPQNLSNDHIRNYLNRACSNHAVNFIKSCTTQKSGRLVSEDSEHTKFSLLVVSENQLTVPLDQEDFSYENLSTEADDSARKFELTFSINELLSKYSVTSKKYRYLMLLMGHEDQHFTRWLHQRNYALDSEDNHDLQLRVSVNIFNKYLSEYLNVSERKTTAFLMRVRHRLGLSDARVSASPAANKVKDNNASDSKQLARAA